MNPLPARVPQHDGSNRTDLKLRISRHAFAHRRHGSLLAGLAIAVSLLGACVTNAPRGGADGADCRSFGSETVQAVRWSPAGDFLAVGTAADNGIGRIRVFGWPGMDLLSEATTDALDTDSAAVDDRGVVYWLTRDPFKANAPTRLWRLEPGASAATIGTVPAHAYLGLTWAGGGLVTTAFEPGPPERSRFVRIDIAHPDAEPTELTAWTSPTQSEVWADPTGEWLVWDESDGPTEPQDFVVQHDGTQQRLRPPGYGGRAMTLSPDRSAVIYQRTETARLTLLNLKTGEVDGELSKMEVYGGEVSGIGILATLTAHGPGEINHLCTVDVNARLAAL